MKPWKILDTGIASAEKNMAIDAALLRDLSPDSSPILHFYEWEKPSATYGHFIDPFRYLQRKGVEASGLQLAKRPTGGGIIFHLSDLAFSLLLPANHPDFSPNALESYAFVHRFLLQAARGWKGNSPDLSLLSCECLPLDASCRQFCMAKPTKYDVLWEGKKIGGGAQRRNKSGYLHQGSLYLAEAPEETLESCLPPGSRVLEAMRSHSSSLLGKASLSQLQEAKREWRALLKKVFCATD